MCDCEQKNKRLKVLHDSMESAVTDFNKDIADKIKLESDITENKVLLDELKSDAWNIVLNEKDSLGKSKFRNEQDRLNALSQVLRNDTRYGPLRDHIKKELQELEKVKARLDLDKIIMKQCEYNLTLETMRK